MAGPSTRHRGWFWDDACSDLEVYVDGTELARFATACNDLRLVGCNGLTVDAGGVTVTAGGVAVCAGGLTVTAGGVTVSACDLTVSAGDLILTGGDIRGAACEPKIQLLCPCGTDIFAASTCSEPSAAKGTVWAYQGDACAVAPTGSAFLVIVDDGCV